MMQINSCQLPNFINGKLFLETGDKVSVKDGKLVDGILTHSVSTIWGNGLGSLDGISVIDLASLELSQIKF